MRALTIHQPYANFIADGEKRYETRSWQTAYRGLLGIHASKNSTEAVYSGIALDGPFGAIVAVGRLVECHRTEYLTEWCENEIVDEMDIGDFSPGRWGWLIKDVEKLAQPIPCRGYQGLWRLSAVIGSPITGAR